MTYFEAINAYITFKQYYYLDQNINQIYVYNLQIRYKPYKIIYF